MGTSGPRVGPVPCAYVDDNTKHEQALIRAVGRQIASGRAARNITQEALAARVGISRKSLSRYEQGERDAQLGTLITIADALGVSVTQLLLSAEALRDHDA